MWTYQNAMFFLFIAIICLGLSSAEEYDVEKELEHQAKSKDYSFSYGVKDMNTGDMKTQWEKKDGDVVRGHYTVLEADGSLRIVDYTADEKSGFNAIVKHKGPSYHPITKYPTSHKDLSIKPNTESVDFNSFTAHSHQIEEHIPQSHSKQYHKQTFIFVPKDETESEDIKEDSKHIHTYVYTKAPEEQSKLQALPIDLSLIKPELETKNVALDVDLLNPHVIDLSDFSDKEVQTYQHHFVEDENVGGEIIDEEEDDKDVKNNFIPENHSSSFHEPHIETGFKPIKNYAQPIEIHSVSNTFSTNIKPVTTPGLMTYASQYGKYGLPYNKQRHELPHYRGPNKPHKAGPIEFPRNKEQRRTPTRKTRRFHGNHGNVRLQIQPVVYTKRVVVENRKK